MRPGEKFVDLPRPGSEAAAHSARLAARIRAEIGARGGWLPFERFLELALYAPGLGYYSAGAHKFGSAGDFVTAPDLSPLFGRCLARQCRDVLAVTGGDVLELGAGSGALAASLLPELEALGTLPQRYLILEPSAELRQRQQQRLAALPPELRDRVAWLDGLPERLRGVILGNEVVDALPVQRFRITDQGPRPLGVALEADRMVWREGPPSARLERRLQALQRELGHALPVGYCSEIDHCLGQWLAALADCLETGLLLLVDYGHPRREYYHPERSDGTLRCYYRHRLHADPFLYPGLQDITASVDFSALADAGLAAGLQLEGYTSQAWFLLGCGLEALLAETGPEAGVAHLDRVRQVKLLTLPEEMGERCKVMAFGRGDLLPLCGFSLCDARSRL